MTQDDAVIYNDLRGTVCVCGAQKARGNSFCRSHYFALPVGLRRELYERDDYPNTFRRACDLLELDPSAAVQPTEKAAS